MPDARMEALQYAQASRPRFLAELKEIVSIASISTDPEYQAEIQKAAGWIADRMCRLGIEHVEAFPTAGHPVVYGDYLKAGQNAPTILVYGHYDVQPAEPLELWESDPFDMAVRGEYVYGRGATDMKGQLAAVFAAIEALLHAGQSPVNLKFILEGEEEIGSPNLQPFIAEHTGLLAADFALNPDTGMLAPDLPTITYALRGLAFFEIRVNGPDHDLHSGVFGGAVHNPAQVLCELIAGMHDKQGRITLPGFYDKVLPLSPEERQELSRLPMDEQFYLQASGAPALHGEAGYLPEEQVGARPSLEVNGLNSGYTGPGGKTVLPSKAIAKISMRLVPNQDPVDVGPQLIQYMQEHAPDTVRWEVIDMQGGPAAISDRNSPPIQALSRAMETVWGKRPVFRREGGSVPVVAHFQQYLKIESLNTGFGLPTDNMHSPNEKLHLPTVYKGIDTLIHFFYNVASNSL